MPRYVIHIGPPKTGSKYLQSMLFHSRKALQDSGINYPDNWWTQPTQIAHDALFNLLIQNKLAEVDAAFKEFSAHNHKTVVLSSEALENLNLEQFGNLRDSIGDNPVDIVYYCRRWCERIPSSWKQAIKTGLFPTLPEYYVESVRHAHYSASINYSLVWDIVCKVFGRESLKLVSYNNLRDGHTDIFRHFAENFLDWQGETAVSEDQLLENVSPNAIDTEILRELNWLHYRTTGRHDADMQIKFNAKRSECDTRKIEQLMANSVASIEISDGSEAFRLSWKDMNCFVDCLVPLTSARQSLFEPNSVSVPYVQTNYLLKEGAAEELHKIYGQLGEAPHAITQINPASCP